LGVYLARRKNQKAGEGVRGGGVGAPAAELPGARHSAILNKKTHGDDSRGRLAAAIWPTRTEWGRPEISLRPDGPTATFFSRLDCNVLADSADVLKGHDAWGRSTITTSSDICSRGWLLPAAHIGRRDCAGRSGVSAARALRGRRNAREFVPVARVVLYIPSPEGLRRSS